MPNPSEWTWSLFCLKKLDRLPGFLFRLTWKSEEAHTVVPNPRLRRQFEVLRHHLRRRRLVHQLQHSLHAGLIAEVEILTPGLLRILPYLLVEQALLKPHVRRPHDPHLALDQPARELPEQGRRVGFVGKVKVFGAIFVSQKLNIRERILDLLRPVASGIALAMVAELAATPVTTARRQIGQNPRRHEILLQRQTVEVRRRQCRQILCITGRRDMDPGLVFIDRVRHLSQAALGPHRRDQLNKGRLPFIDHGTVEVLEQR